MNEFGVRSFFRKLKNFPGFTGQSGPGLAPLSPLSGLVGVPQGDERVAQEGIPPPRLLGWDAPDGLGDMLKYPSPSVDREMATPPPEPLIFSSTPPRVDTPGKDKGLDTGVNNPPFFSGLGLGLSIALTLILSQTLTTTRTPTQIQAGG